MAQNSFALMTTLGRSKEAAALANGTAVVVTHIAIGDGSTVPSGGETALYHEIARKAISGHGTVVGASDTAYFDIFLEAAEGPYTIREAGLIDDAGDLIAIARYDPPINKPIPSSGQTVEGTVRLQVAFSNIANITVVVDPSYKVPLQRLNRLPWLPVLSMTLTAPPASPAVGDVYLVATGASGAWTGQSGKIAEYTASGWGIITPPDGHGISLPDGRVLEKVGGTYIEKLALDAQSGKWNYAVSGGTANALTATLTPAPVALTSGLQVSLAPSVSPSGGCTLNLNGLGAKPIMGPDGEPVRSGDMMSGSLANLIYSVDLGGWVLIAAARLGTQIVGCKAMGTAITTLASGVLTAVQHTDLVYSTGDEYNLATGVFTVEIPGVYVISANFYFESIDSPTFLFVTKNGVNVSEAAANSRARVLAVTTSEPCAAGDVIVISVRQSSAATMTLDSAIRALKYPFATSITLAGTL